jgi:hypothetical protein
MSDIRTSRKEPEKDTFGVGEDEDDVGVAEAELGPRAADLVVALVQGDSVLVLLRGQPLRQPEIGRLGKRVASKFLLERKLNIFCWQFIFSF